VGRRSFFKQEERPMLAQMSFILNAAIVISVVAIAALA